jgi:hypothetical protein
VYSNSNRLVSAEKVLRRGGRRFDAAALARLDDGELEQLRKELADTQSRVEVGLVQVGCRFTLSLKAPGINPCACDVIS